MKTSALILLSVLLSTKSAFADFLPQAFSSKFEQTYISTLKGKEKKGQGSIEYKFPGSIRFETNSPSTVIFVSNGVKAWYYRAPFIEGEQGEVTESSAKDGSTIYIKFFDSLKKGLVSNDYYDVKKGQPIKLTFKPHAQKELGITDSEISFKVKGSEKFEDVDSIALIFSDGKKSTLKLIDLKTSPNFPADRFNFIAPANTKKVN
jgi:outer membrane lipoprotein-sorting protein